MPRFQPGLTVLCLLLLSAADPASRLPGSNPVSSMSYGQQLAEMSFYGACLYGVPATRPGMISTLPFWHLMETKNQAKFNALPHFAQMQIAGWIVPRGNGGAETVIPSNGSPITCGDTLMTFIRHAKGKAVAPQSAAEILDHIFELETPDMAKARFDLLMNGNPEEYPRYFLSLINPQTRKLYASFDGSVPEPGGLIFRKVDDIEGAKRLLAEWEHAPEGLIGEDFAGAWEIKLQGAQPGEILDTGHAIMHH